MPVSRKLFGCLTVAGLAIGASGAALAQDYGDAGGMPGYGPPGLDGAIADGGLGLDALGGGLASGIGLGTGALGGPAYGNDFHETTSPGLKPGWAYGPPPEPRRYVVRQTMYHRVTNAYSVPVPSYRLVQRVRVVPVTEYRRVVTEEVVPTTRYRVIRRTVAVPASVYREVHRSCDCGE